MSELNPCPICGCSVRVWAKRFDEEDMEYIIECDNDFCGLTYGISCGYNREEIKKAWNSVTALSPTVSEDCISRANLPKKLNGVVLDDCDKIVDEFLEEHECDELWNVVRALRDFYDWTMDAPPVTPTEKTGEWVEREDWNGDNYYDCSVCGESFVLIDGTPSMNKYHYCPNCGAKMKG